MKKALECCISAESCCVCGYTKMCDGTTIHQFAPDLINRQQAEIEKYKAEIKIMLEEDVYSLADQVIEQQTEIEILKEAVEIHKGIAEDWKYEAKKLKEMVGEQK